MDNFDPWQKKFTPGSWQVDPERGQVVIAPEQPPVVFSIANIEYVHPFIVVQAGLYVTSENEGEIHANARLIAAAPDLIEVCERVLAEAEMGVAVISHRLFDLARVAANKAYGYQPQVTFWSSEWQGG